jgi:SAM-dependent methyltransferase
MLMEAISHIRDTALLLDRIKDVLRPGGALYISDGNNDLFFNSMIRSRKAWRKAEWGPIDIRYRYGRRVDKLSFFDARMGIIKSLYPSIDNKTLNLIARKTQGMYGLEITRAVEEFMATRKIHKKASFPYRNPYTGEFQELGINPFKLIENLKARGFRCKLMPPIWAYIGVSPRTSRLKTIATRTISPFLRNSPDFLLPFLNPSFQIIAIKEKE